MVEQLASKRIIFCGNRSFILKEMFATGLNVVEIAAVSGSYLARELDADGIEFHQISTRENLLDWLLNTDFDIFVSNGCPFLIPVNKFDEHKLFVNVHPSLLPDLRGGDPVPGAILFHRDSGATCHLMDDDFDTGPIISQVRIPYTDDLDAPLLYQLSFLAEKKVFRAALARNFKPICEQKSSISDIYYTKNPEDSNIDFNSSAKEIISKVRAFANQSQGARFRYGSSVLRVFGAMELKNSYLHECQESYTDNQVVLNYECFLVISKNGGFLKLGPIDGNLGDIQMGKVLGQ